MRVLFPLLVGLHMVSGSAVTGCNSGFVEAEDTLGSAKDGGGSSVVTVSVPQDPRLDPELVVDGCAAWSAVDVTCALALDRDAEIRFHIDDRECVEEEDGTYILAEAFTDTQTVALYWNCLQQTDNKDRLLRTVVAHEVGHLLGIITHVPRLCEDDAYETSDEGVPICGRAVMNPLVDEAFDGVITAYDLYAFELHGHDIDLAPHEKFRHDGPDCSLHGAGR